MFHVTITLPGVYKILDAPNAAKELPMLRDELNRAETVWIPLVYTSSEWTQMFSVVSQ